MHGVEGSKEEFKLRGVTKGGLELGDQNSSPMFCSTGAATNRGEMGGALEADWSMLEELWAALAEDKSDFPKYS